MKHGDYNSVWSYLALFWSGSTLICCALPSLFVFLGAGAVFASMIEIFPVLITISENKTPLFLIAFLVLVLAGFIQWLKRDQSCPADPAQADACARARKWNRVVYGLSWIGFLMGVFFTFILPGF